MADVGDWADLEEEQTEATEELSDEEEHREVPRATGAGETTPRTTNDTHIDIQIKNVPLEVDEKALRDALFDWNYSVICHWKLKDESAQVYAISISLKDGKPQWEDIIQRELILGGKKTQFDIYEDRRKRNNYRGGRGGGGRRDNNSRGGSRSGGYNNNNNNNRRQGGGNRYNNNNNNTTNPSNPAGINYRGINNNNYNRDNRDNRKSNYHRDNNNTNARRTVEHDKEEIFKAEEIPQEKRIKILPRTKPIESSEPEIASDSHNIFGGAKPREAKPTDLIPAAPSTTTPTASATSIPEAITATTTTDAAPAVQPPGYKEHNNNNNNNKYRNNNRDSRGGYNRRGGSSGSGGYRNNNRDNTGEEGGERRNYNDFRRRNNNRDSTKKPTTTTTTAAAVREDEEGFVPVTGKRALKQKQDKIKEEYKPTSDSKLFSNKFADLA